MTGDEPKDGIDWAGTFRSGFGKSFWLFVAFAAVMSVGCYAVIGPDAFASAVDRNSELMTGVLPRVIAAQLLAGFVWVLLPRERLSAFLEKNRGRRGLLVAAAVGAITPGGPASAFPFLAILAGLGADVGILVAYITSWALIGVQRIIVWDMPFMGADFSLLRLLVSLPLPILAAIVARRLPLTVSFESHKPRGEQR